AGKLTDWKGEAINDTDGGIVGHEGVTHRTPEPFLHDPQIDRLSHKGGAVQVRQGRKEDHPMLPKVIEECLILIQAKVHPNDLHREDFAIGQGGLWTALAHLLMLRHEGQQIVDQAKPGDHEFIQVHRSSPRASNTKQRQEAAPWSPASAFGSMPRWKE